MLASPVLVLRELELVTKSLGNASSVEQRVGKGPPKGHVGDWCRSLWTVGKLRWFPNGPWT